MSIVGSGDIVGGKYRLEQQLGEGGMGLVFAATHLGLEQRVAIKFLREEAAKKPEAVERFTREARAAAKVQSEHVARVLDIAFLDSGAPYIVMEYLEGEDLAQITSREAIPVEDAVRHVLGACEALAEVHAQGMVHRDFKPSNLFLALRPDGSRRVKLLDFGITKAVAGDAGGAASNLALTRTSAVLGSPRYMSPEQLKSARDVDARSDIWAVGVTLYELLGGGAPFGTGTLAEVCAAILKEPPPPLARGNPALPAALVDAVHRCLEKEPSARFADLAAFAAAIAPFGPDDAPKSVERIAGVLDRAAARDDAGAPSVSGGAAVVIDLDAEDRVTARPPSGRHAAAAAPAAAASPTERTDEILARLGDRSRVLRVAVHRDDLPGLGLEPRAAFLLSRVDGTSTVDEVLDVCGMPQDEALEVLDHLLGARLLVIDASPMPR